MTDLPSHGLKGGDHSSDPFGSAEKLYANVDCEGVGLRYGLIFSVMGLAVVIVIAFFMESGAFSFGKAILLATRWPWLSPRSFPSENLAHHLWGYIIGGPVSSILILGGVLSHFVGKLRQRGFTERCYREYMLRKGFVAVPVWLNRDVRYGGGGGTLGHTEVFFAFVNTLANKELAAEGLRILHARIPSESESFRQRALCEISGGDAVRVSAIDPKLPDDVWITNMPCLYGKLVVLIPSKDGIHASIYEFRRVRDPEFADLSQWSPGVSFGVPAS